ncbi:MAG: hypothetical protein KDB60_00605 [Propionibacteriaceae bacterium]|nr:hypothetical protein [Propionibacteriaceae bacterium]
MKLGRGRVLGAAALAALGVIGFVGVLLTIEPRRTAMPALDVATSTISTDELTEAARVKVFFGHVSVGENILSGVGTLYRELGVPEASMTEFDRDGALPLVAPEGGIVHTIIGDNEDPLGKLKNFDTVLRAGLADEIDVAVLKFCYVDITRSTDVTSLFQQYRTTLAALERDFPEVTFVHSTAPLMVTPSGVKATLKSWLGRDDNVAREQYNTLMRQAYEPERLFDIAAVEGTAPNGARSIALYDGYTTDGGHLNETGSALVAAELLRLIAAGDVS